MPDLLKPSMPLATAALASVAAAGSLPPLEAELYASGLVQPVEFVQHPTRPDVQFIAQQNGVVRVIEGGALLADPLIDLSSLLQLGHPERGLVGMAIDPASPSDLYLQYTRQPAGASRVDRFEITSEAPWTAAIAPRDEIIDRPQPSAIHSGNAIRFGPDGFFYVSYGDGGPVGDPNAQGQNIDSLYATIVRIDPRDTSGYTVPADNPFVGGPGLDEIWHYGLRNVWKFSFDAGPCSTGGLVMGDVGDALVEEINFALPDAPGQNFGWSCLEGSVPFTGCAPPAGEAFTAPFFEYDRPSGLGTSVTAGYVYRGRDMPHHRGRVFFGDFISGKVMSVRLALDPVTGAPMASDFVDHSAELAASLGFNLSLVVAFGRDAGGELYVVSYAGRVYRLSMQGEPADLDLDGAVGASDLAAVVSAWGGTDCSPADLSNDGFVGAEDLARLISKWGAVAP